MKGERDEKTFALFAMRIYNAQPAVGCGYPLTGRHFRHQPVANTASANRGGTHLRVQIQRDARKVTDDERTGLKLMQTEAASRERQRAPLLGGQKKQHVSTGVSPAQNMRPDATAALDRPTNATSPRSMVDLSTTPTRASVAAARRTKLFEAGGFSSDASARAARAPPPLAEQQQQQQQHFPPSMLDGSSDVLPATPGSASRRIRLRTALEQPEPEAFARTAPLSPSHRPVKMQYPVANEELHQMPLPPRDMYPAIQLHLGLASAENDADAAAAAAGTDSAVLLSPQPLCWPTLADTAGHRLRLHRLGALLAIQYVC